MKLPARVLYRVGVAVPCCFLMSAAACQMTGPKATYVSARSLPGSHSATAVEAEREFKEAAVLRNKRTQADLRRAIDLLVDSARQFNTIGATARAASAEIEAGDTYVWMSAYPHALSAYQRALALDPNHPETKCLALGHIARTYANIGSNVVAEQYSERTAVPCAQVSDKKILGDVSEAQGEVKFWAADSPSADDYFVRSRQLAEEAGDDSTEAMSMMMLAQDIHSRDHDQSMSLARRAMALWKKADDQYGAARGHLAMAFFAGEDGNFRSARCHCEQALSVFSSTGDKDNEGVALNDLALVAKQSGDGDAALEDYVAARRNFVAAQDRLGEADSLDGIAGVRRGKGEYGSLLPLYERELRLAQVANNRSLRASALVSIADVHLHAHRYAEAELYYRQSLDEYAKTQNRYGEGIAYLRLASLAMEQGRLAQALDLLQQARKLKEQTGELEDQARIGYLQARVHLRLNQPDEARPEIERTIAIIESQRLRIDKFDSRAQYFASVHQDYALYIHVLMALDERYPEKKYRELAFEVAEKSKVRSLLDMLSESQLAAPCDEVLAQEAEPSPEQSQPQGVHPSAANASRALTLTEIQTEIGDRGTVLLEYAFDEDRAFAWLVDGEHVSAFDLGPAAKILSHLQAFRASLVPVQAKQEESPLAYLQRLKSAKNDVLHQSRQLADLLLGPVNLPRQKRVLIVPDGPLQSIPFAALSVSTDAGNASPLIEQNELVMLPSASVLSSLRKIAAGRPRPSTGITVFADPVFEQSTANLAATARLSNNTRSLTRALHDSQDSQYIPSLPGSRTEALAIQQVFGADRTRLALGYDANRGAVIDGSLANQQIVHFATHGIVDAYHPEMSGLVLSLRTKSGKPRDGYLRLEDIYNLKLSADLVVLSSCESALGKDLGSEGIIGLPRGFLYAGARSVIASLWKVNDAATATLMRAFYEGIQRGEGPGKALQQAQLTLHKSRNLSDPYNWAAFFLEGEYQ
jgi:CHAT domain-containing protein